MFRLSRWSLAALLAACLLALSGFSCYGHHGPTEVVACSDLAGSWEEVADNSCLGTGRRAAVSLRQTGCTVFASSSGLQAEVTLALSERDQADVNLTFPGCTGSARGTATVNGHRIDAQFQGTISGPHPYCCGNVKGSFLWVR